MGKICLNVNDKNTILAFEDDKRTILYESFVDMFYKAFLENTQHFQLDNKNIAAEDVTKILLNKQEISIPTIKLVEFVERYAELANAEKEKNKETKEFEELSRIPEFMWLFYQRYFTSSGSGVQYVSAYKNWPIDKATAFVHYLRAYPKK